MRLTVRELLILKPGSISRFIFAICVALAAVKTGEAQLEGQRAAEEHHVAVEVLARGNALGEVDDEPLLDQIGLQSDHHCAGERTQRRPEARRDERNHPLGTAVLRVPSLRV